MVPKGRSGSSSGCPGTEDPGSSPSWHSARSTGGFWTRGSSSSAAPGSPRSWSCWATAKFERVETLSTMLRHCSPQEYDEAVEIFERATARAERPRRASSRRTTRDRQALLGLRRAPGTAPPLLLTDSVRQPALSAPLRRPLASGPTRPLGTPAGSAVLRSVLGRPDDGQGVDRSHLLHVGRGHVGDHGG